MERHVEKGDVIIVGAGPAGLSAAIFTQPDGWKTLVLESNWVGGQGATVYTVFNYPGFTPGDGRALMETMEKQAALPPHVGVGAELRHEKVINMDPDKLEVITEVNWYKAGAIILGTGSEMRALSIPGEGKFVGKGASYYAVRDAEMFAGKKLWWLKEGIRLRKALQSLRLNKRSYSRSPQRCNTGTSGNGKEIA